MSYRATRNAAAGVALFWLSVLVIIGVGYVMNILDLIGMPLDPLTGEAVVRIVGIFVPPLGAFMGIFV